jgi:hypothetical protein
MRKTVTLGTYMKVQKYFDSNPNKSFNKTFLRDNLNIDFYSLTIILNELMKGNFIRLKDKEYKLQGN